MGDIRIVFFDVHVVGGQCRLRNSTCTASIIINRIILVAQLPIKLDKGCDDGLSVIADV